MKNCKITFVIALLLLFDKNVCLSECNVLGARGGRVVKTWIYNSQGFCVTNYIQQSICGEEHLSENNKHPFKQSALYEFHISSLRPSMAQNVFGKTKTSYIIASNDFQNGSKVFSEINYHHNIVFVQLQEDLPFDMTVPMDMMTKNNCITVEWNLNFYDLPSHMQLFDFRQCSKVYLKHNVPLPTEINCVLFKNYGSIVHSEAGKSRDICDGYFMGVYSLKKKAPTGQDPPLVYTNFKKKFLWILQSVAGFLEPKRDAIPDLTIASATAFKAKFVSIINFALMYLVNKYVLL